MRVRRMKPDASFAHKNKKTGPGRKRRDIYVTIAKIAPPRLPPAVPRTRLFKLLDRACRRPMVWISAPAGAGKTTLAASYTQARRLPMLWYQIDETDADIATFFHYFSLAVAGVNRRGRLPAFTPAHFPSLVAFARRFFEAVATALPAHVLIVLDNYQDLPQDAPLHAVLHQAIGQMPRGVTLLVLSRNDPPAVYSPARAHRLITCHGADALRLTDQESLAVVKLHSTRRVSRDMAHELHAQTGGWVAGLTMLLERSRYGDPATSDPVEARGALFNYLATEIFALMPPRTQMLLLKTALLPHVAITVAEQVTGFPDSAALLVDFNRRHYFTLRLYGRRVVYQYHPLFHEFLLGEARQRLSREEIKTVECAAAAALLHDGQVEDAIELLLRAEDWEQASATLLAQAPALIAQGRNLTLARWLNALPEDIRHRAPWLGYWRGMCEMMLNPPRALELFAGCFTVFEAQQDHTGQCVAIAGAMDVIFIGQGEQSANDIWIARFDRLLKGSTTFTSADTEGRIWSSVLRSVGWRQPDHPRFQDWLTCAEDVWTRMHDPDARLGLAGVLYFTHGIMGHRAKADWFEKKLLRLLMASVPVTPLNANHCRMYLSYLSTFRGETEPARRIVHEALAYADTTGMHVTDAHIVGTLIYANLLDADIAAADASLARMGEWLAETPETLDAAHYEMMLGWRALIVGELAVARDHAKRAVRMTQRIGAVYPASLCRYGLAHVLVEQGDYDTAVTEINKARLNANAAYGAWMNYQCDMLLAHLEFRRGRDDVGFRRLRSALIRGRECGFSQPLWFRPRIMAELCARALEKGIEAEHVQALARQRRLVLPAKGAVLSAREREILTLAAKGMNRAEIARALGIRPTTVATHIGAVYRKLNISNRSEATVEAIRLGLTRP